VTEAGQLIAIGTSAGGVEALRFLLGDLPAQAKTPIIVTLHLPEHSDVTFSKFIESRNHQVREAHDKMSIDDGTINFAPPGYHLLIEKNKTFALSQDEPVFFSRPSIDVMFESAALVYRQRLTAILLTGANEDGAKGLLTVHQLGGKTVVQDPSDAQAPTMPAAALALFRPDKILSLAGIRKMLITGFHGEEASWRI
jgi:two-component system chemotaxis response regulator CheB